MNGRVHALILVPVLLCSGGTPADTSSSPGSFDWPQWRGPDRDAVSGETGLVDGWGEEGPNVVWRVEAGRGFSSVSVLGNRLYTSWDESDRQFLVCLDTATGRELWRRDIGSSFHHHYGDGPRTTPLVDDGLVFAISTDGTVVAADRFAGEAVWTRDLVDEFGSRLPSYGYSSSPVVVGNHLILETGGVGAAFAALDKRTGETVWTAGDDPPAYSSPIAIEIDGVRQVVFWSALGLHALDPGTGERLWRHPWETLCPVTGDPLNTGTPVFVPPDRIFLSSGSGAAVLRLTRIDGTFHVRTVWQSEAMRSDVNTGLVVGKRVFGFDRATLKSLDVETGEERWRARGFQRGSLIAADGKLFVLGEQGSLAIVKADPERYVAAASAKVLTGRNWTSPVLADGRLYLRNQDEIVCIDVRRNGHGTLDARK
jgi:outer membrane protein assembly factor BamB